MQRSEVHLLLVGIVFHLLYGVSIFDIYFRSPLFSGMVPVKNPLPAPADRVVIFLADGCRADKFFETFTNKETGEDYVNTPYIQSLILDGKASFGVSHTRVPTESRPGNVAVVAGIYEDVSAVTTGWQLNPVSFDSTFNQSSHTYSWGSPNILLMFKYGADPPEKVYADCYDEEEEDFSKDGTPTDLWTFDRATKFFEDLPKEARQPGVVFYVHLIGLDTNGHNFGPQHEVYYNNIRVVDRGIKELQKTIEKAYGNDGRTSYIVTADHGMHDGGSHGDGHPDNTRTPIVAWGAGIRPAAKKPIGHDDYSKNWARLKEFERRDIEQADIAALSTSLVGNNFPVNCVGRLPVDYLDGDEYFRHTALLTNTKSVANMFIHKTKMMSRTHIRFQPFDALANGVLENSIELIEGLLKSGTDFKEANRLTQDLFDKCLAGLRYLQTYDWLFLRTVVTFGYIGWILYCITFVQIRYVGTEGAASISSLALKISAAMFSVITVGIGGFLLAQESRPMYYAYTAFAVFFWFEVIRHSPTLLRLATWRNVGIALIVLAFMEFLVFSFYNRAALSVGLIVVAAFACLRQEWLLAVSCVVSSVFTVLPPIGKSQSLLLIGLGTVVCLVLLAILSLISNSFTMRFLIVNMSASVLAAIVTFQSQMGLDAGEGLSLFTQIHGWGIVFSSIPRIWYCQMTCEPSKPLTTLGVFSAAILPLFIILSVSYEVIFFAAFSTLLIAWVDVEMRTTAKPVIKTGEARMTDRDIPTALTFLFLVNYAFFGTGNIASVSSFQLDSITRLVTQFAPFLMGTLLVLKLLVPFVPLLIALGLIGHYRRLPKFALLILAVSLTDIITINFFFLVRDEGSWLEIGSTISHFIIGNAFIIFFTMLGLLDGVFLASFRGSTREKLE